MREIACFHIRVNAASFQEELERVVKTNIGSLRSESSFIFQQNAVTSHKATQTWMRLFTMLMFSKTHSVPSRADLNSL